MSEWIYGLHQYQGLPAKVLLDESPTGKPLEERVPSRFWESEVLPRCWHWRTRNRVRKRYAYNTLTQVRRNVSVHLLIVLCSWPRPKDNTKRYRRIPSVWSQDRCRANALRSCCLCLFEPVVQKILVGDSLRIAPDAVTIGFSWRSCTILTLALDQSRITADDVETPVIIICRDIPHSPKSSQCGEQQGEYCLSLRSLLISKLVRFSERCECMGLNGREEGKGRQGVRRRTGRKDEMRKEKRRKQKEIKHKCRMEAGSPEVLFLCYWLKPVLPWSVAGKDGRTPRA